jgi:hypothetical protein
MKVLIYINYIRAAQIPDARWSWQIHSYVGTCLLVHITEFASCYLLTPKTLRYRPNLDFWKVCAPMTYIKPSLHNTCLCTKF